MQILRRTSTDEFERTLTALKGVHARYAKLAMKFQEVHPYGFHLTSERYTDIPKEYGKRVRSMLLHSPGEPGTAEDFLSILCHYGEWGYLMPHTHEEHESIVVLDGELVNGITKEKHPAGSHIYIPSREPHYYVTEGSECYLYIRFSKVAENVSEPSEESISSWMRFLSRHRDSQK